MKNKKYYLLLGVFVVIGFATYFAVMHSREMTAAQQIERTGSYVDFNYHGPNWLVKLWGNAYPCKTVREVIMGQRTSDRDLSVLASLKYVRIVMLNLTDVKGPGLAQLKNMPKLENLDLTKSAITDEGLVYLNGLAIKDLSLAATKITDEGVIQLQHLTNLQNLDLADTKVTDRSFQYLSHLPLKWLNIRSTLITSNSIASFQKEHPDVHIIQ
jgi:Leucine-rich repeat (LRR) protein